jgi:hypothetical protein
MPLLCFFFAMQLNRYMVYSISPVIQRVLYIVVIITSILLPLFSVLLLYQSGRVQSWAMEKKEERLLPFLTTAFFQFAAYMILLYLPIPRIFSAIMLGACAVSLTVLLISLRWKISVHLAGIGGVTGLFSAMTIVMFVNLMLPVLFSLVVAGALGTARLSISNHTPLQIYAGFAAGFIFEFLSVYYLSG